MSKTDKRLLSAAATVSFVLCSAGVARADNTRICVDISLQRATKKPGAPRPPPRAEPPAKPPSDGAVKPDESAAPPGDKPPVKVNPPREEELGVVVPGSDGDMLPRDLAPLNGLPLGQRPLAYMKRLIEHFASHEKGFTAVQTGCEQTIFVELYPLVDGWTAFARYTGTGREERVDRLLPSELSQFAERAVTSLLYGKPISATINRENVLTSDSKEYAQRVRGSAHFIMGVGTQLRWGHFGTAVTDKQSKQFGDSVEANRFFSPVSAFLGYRGRFESWGLELGFMGGLGTAHTSILKNPGGGHVDFAGDAAIDLHFLRYFDPRGLTSFYLGAGSTFEMLVFQAILPSNKRQDGTRAYLLGGGVDVDLVLGWEFMRASSAQFFLETDVQLPAYVLSNENAAGGIHTWFPGAYFKLGVMF